MPEPTFTPTFNVTVNPDGSLTVNAVPERKANGDLIMHVPSFIEMQNVINNHLGNNPGLGGKP